MKSSRSRVVEQVLAERLDARRVAQVEAEDLEAVAPVREVRLLRVAGRRVAREARRHDQLRAGAQQLDPGLVADLHAAAGEQRDAAAQVGRLGALREVEVAAGGAELVVERVHARRTAACRRSSAAARRARGTRASPSTSDCSNAAGGKTFGVVNTGFSRSTRIPVSASTASSRSRFAPLLGRRTALAQRGAARRRG